jgi:hypothetical protein
LFVAHPGDEGEDGDEVDNEVEDYMGGATGLNPMISGSIGNSTHKVDTIEDARRLYL